MTNDDQLAQGQHTDGFKITGFHVLAGIVSFFLIVFLANGVFLYQAISTYTGVVSQQPYRKGLDYNDRIAAQKAQTATGWTDTITLDTTNGKVHLSIADRTGAPVRGLQIKGTIGRPSTNTADVALSLQQEANGGYIAHVGELPSGAWLITAEASRQKADGPHIVYRVRKRIWLAPPK